MEGWAGQVDTEREGTQEQTHQGQATAHTQHLGKTLTLCAGECKHVTTGLGESWLRP